ncbi:13403_t:CDS:2, partial [Entrophospora sp. SA101]
MLEISENSNLQLQYTGSIINGNVDSDVTPTLNETESQPSNDNFTLLYEKLCDVIILADHKTQEAILFSRILNKEVCAQLPANTSDALLWKRIKK